MIGIRTLGCWNEEGKVQTNPLSFGGKTVVTTFGIVANQIKRTYIKILFMSGMSFWLDALQTASPRKTICQFWGR